MINNEIDEALKTNNAAVFYVSTHFVDIEHLVDKIAIHLRYEIN